MTELRARRKWGDKPRLAFAGLMGLAVILAACTHPQAAPPSAIATLPLGAVVEPTATPSALPVAATAIPVKPEVPSGPTTAARAVAPASPTANRAAPVPTRSNVPKLTLIVTAPQDESIVTANTVLVTGQTSTGAVVSVDGDLVDVDTNGRFRTSVKLDEGPNSIEVEASDVNGNELGTVLSVIYEP